MIEIERKFIVQLLEPPPADLAMEIVQGYLSTGDPEVRIRSYDHDDYWLTVKLGAGLERTEVEVPLHSLDGKPLLDLCKHRIEKTRYDLPHEWELDVFGGPHRGLVILEIELETATAPLPPFPDSVRVIREVTGLPEYANKHLAVVFSG